MINDQEYITTELKKTLEKMIILSTPRLNNIIFDHTTIDDRFVILQFSLKVGKRAIPLWFKLFKYKQDGNKDFIHVKEGLKFLHKILTPYEFDVTILADRGFKSIDLFKFIDETLKWKCCIRCTKDMGISIAGKSKIKKLDDITPTKWSTKYFYNIKLTAQEYICNMAVCKAQDAEDVWFIANNLSEPYAIREYKKRFDIEEMFRDFKSNGFNLENTWSTDIHYAKMLYFCVCIAYSYIVSLGTSCTKDKKNKLLSATKNIKGKKIRIYSLFTTGIKWFKRSYYSCRNKYYLKTCFTIYQG